MELYLSSFTRHSRAIMISLVAANKEDAASVIPSKVECKAKE